MGGQLAITVTMFVATSLKIEVFAKGAPDLKIGQAVLTIDGSYAPGPNNFSMTGNGSAYTLALDLQ